MKFKICLLFFSGLFIIQSCKNDIEINAPWKETAVVNGFLDISTSQQFIRITKAFQNASNLTPQQSAQISDSIYFDTLFVKITDLSDTSQNFLFYKNTSIPKDSGYFSNNINILYACYNFTPILGHVYKLFILNPKSGKTYTSQTSIVGQTHIMPTNTPPNNIYKLDIFYDPNIPNYIQFQWNPVPSASIYTALIRYNYIENNNPISKSIDQYISINDQTVFFYNFFSSQMNQFLINSFGRRDTADHSVYRKITEIDYVVLSGSSDLLTAVDLSKPNTSLLQVKPDFTNIQNGLGLFTSRSTSILNVPFDMLTPYSSEKNLTLNVRGFAQP